MHRSSDICTFHTWPV